MLNVLQYFSTLSHKWHNFRKKNLLEPKMFVLNFCTKLSKTLVILGRIQRDMIKNVYRSSCKVPVILVLFS